MRDGLQRLQAAGCCHRRRLFERMAGSFDVGMRVTSAAVSSHTAARSGKILAQFECVLAGRYACRWPLPAECERRTHATEAGHEEQLVAGAASTYCWRTQARPRRIARSRRDGGHRRSPPGGSFHIGPTADQFTNLSDSSRATVPLRAEEVRTKAANLLDAVDSRIRMRCCARGAQPAARHARLRVRKILVRVTRGTSRYRRQLQPSVAPYRPSIKSSDLEEAYQPQSRWRPPCLAPGRI